MNTYRYAAYGSNLHPIRLQERVPSAKLLGTSRLDAYDLKFNKLSSRDRSGKCNIVPGENGVYLAVFEILESERSILDTCEGLGSGYNAIELELAGFGRCSSYVADTNSVDECLRPMDWYKEMVLLGCAAHRFAELYIQTIETISTIEDQDGDRAREQWQLIEKLRNGAQCS